ncbi:hypothetical protein Taro_036722 [Colocasia esculenta]|uniref:BRCT domain-containing protein n=1 Tax=Colocasia esculenta TaxID=4460 RepID=A0A843WIN4_COLES|nr:hypothetical protein [Colocasia esculenta]
MQKLIIQNGGKYSADLTKKCTHLISDISFHYAYIFRLDEGRYPVHRGSIPCNSIQNSMKEQYSQSQSNKTSQPMPPADCPDIDITMSQNLSSTFSDGNNLRSQDSDVPVMPSKGEPKVDGNVAEDSEEEDNDLYLSSCRILLVGFVEKELRRLVSMIRRGGGSRHMSLSEKLTHIILGTPSDNEKKEVRRLAAWGVINVVKTAWLEDCEQMKKEVPVSQRHVACDLLLPKGPLLISMTLFSPSVRLFAILTNTTSFNKSGPAGTSEIKNVKNSTALPSMPTSEIHFDKSDGELSLLGRSMGTETCQVIPKETNVSYITTKSSLGSKLNSVNAEDNVKCRLLSNANSSGTQRQATNVFKGLSFCFSGSFPKDKRAEIEEWVIQGGGSMTTNHGNVNFIIECHGLIQKLPDPCPATMVSSHWVRFCLEEGCLLDVGSHILFSPLRCHIPLSGYQGIRFCISQYEDKERVLLKNLCFTLGGKFTEKLTKRVTHLLCKFAFGPKYEAACNWGIESVTAEWINECIRQDMMVAMDQFRPKVVSALDRETGLCITSQYPTQAACMTSVDASSQLLNESILCATKQTIGIRSDRYSEVPDFSGTLNKRQKYSENDNIYDGSPKTNIVEDMKRGSNTVSDVADVIEDLLAQSNKDTRTAEENGCHQIVSFVKNPYVKSLLLFRHDVVELFDKQFSTSSPASEKNPTTFDAFSETQTESQEHELTFCKMQVVWYEEDLSGRQKIIERVRSQSMTLTPEPK